MAKSVAQLTEQMQRIQQQLDAAKAKEVKGVVARIQEAISHYGLTPADLFPSGGKRANGAASSKNRQPRGAKLSAAKKVVRSKAAGVKLPAKFTDGAGNSWTGRGSTPRWLVDAIAAGKTKEDFAVKV